MSTAPDPALAAEIEHAAARLRGQIIDTPCLHSRTLSEITGGEVLLKFENHQFTASFKERGALTSWSRSPRRSAQPASSPCSAGNHAQGVAYHAQRLGIPRRIVMPRFTPSVKVEHTRSFGAEVMLHGDNFDDARRPRARSWPHERGLTFVHPYDDEKSSPARARSALEMLRAAAGARHAGRGRSAAAA